jgi:uncharacterized phage protein gp47/JayE
MAWGVTSTGFNRPTLAEIKTEIEASYKAFFGNSIDVSPQSNFGQLIGIAADREFALWSMGEALAQNFTPDGAVGVPLDNLCALTGTVRHPATKSAVIAVATGDNGTSLPAGRVVAVAVTGVRFASTTDATLTTVTEYNTLGVGDSIAKGDRVWTDEAGTLRVYECVIAGLTSGSLPPFTESAAVTDNTVTWAYCGRGKAASALPVQSEDTGLKVAVAGTLTTIVTAVSGWQSVGNLLDATLGTDLESDAALRVRRNAELQTQGAGTLGAIRAAVLEVDAGTSSEVTACGVFENTTDATVDSMPPHSVEVLVQGGVDADLAAAIFGEVAAGIQTYGNQGPFVVMDSQGVDHNLYFSRPTAVPIYIIANVSVDVTKFPSDGATQVKNAIVAYGDAQVAGKDVVSRAIGAAGFAIPGVIDVEALIGTAPTPTLTTTIVATSRQLPTYDTSRVTVNVSLVTP